MKLTANFSLVEMTKSETALRHDIDNTPDADQLENLTSCVSACCSPCGSGLVCPLKSIQASAVPR